MTYGEREREIETISRKWMSVREKEMDLDLEQEEVENRR